MGKLFGTDGVRGVAGKDLTCELSLKIGRSVQWDHDNLKCLGDEEATKLLKREYRAPFVYPEV